MYSNFALISSAWPVGTPVKSWKWFQWSLGLEFEALSLAALFSPFNLSDNDSHSAPEIGLITG